MCNMKYLVLIASFTFPFISLCQYDCDDKVFDDTTYTGVCVEKYPNGKIHFRSTYKNGTKDGLYEEFYENGELQASANYLKWNLIGISKRYHENGSLELIIETDSLGNGTLKRYFENGSIQTEGQFKLGYRIGSWIEYDKSGKIISRTEEDVYKWLSEQQEEADEKNKDPDSEYRYAVDWTWSVEHEFYENEDW